MTSPKAFFLPVGDGQRFCLFHAPVRAVGQPAALVFVHAFAEEMNKSRRMVALQSRALAAAGHAVLQIDLHGCGDSSGDFGDATWESWLQDITIAVAWLRARVDAPLWLWGHRVGCLLAADAGRRMGHDVNYLFWQPVAMGKSFLQQFLRLKLAGDLVRGEPKGSAEGSGEHTGAGNPVEVAGYVLSPAMIVALRGASLSPPTRVRRLEWVEVVSRVDAGPLPALNDCWDAWSNACHVAMRRTVACPMFWQTSEIEECPAMIEATVMALSEYPK